MTASCSAHLDLEEAAITTLTDRPAVRASAGSAPRRTLIGGRPPHAIERWLIAGLLLWLLVGPRIELPLVRNMRVEDLVFLALAGVCLLHVRPIRRPSAITLAVAGVVLTGLVSAVIASLRGMVEPVGAVLFALRPMEYWVAFPAVLLLLRAPGRRWITRFDGLLVIVTVLQTAFAVLQYYFGQPIGFSHAAYTRAAGLTVGPYELGAISAMLVVYWISRGRWAMASLSTIALASSISRISILGAALAAGALVLVWVVRFVLHVRAGGVRAALRPYHRAPLLIVGQASSVVAAVLVLAFTVGVLHLPEIVLPTPQVAEQPADSAVPAAEPSAVDSGDVPVEAAPVGPQAPSNSIAQRLASTSVLGSWNAADALAARVPHPKDAVEYQYAAYAGLNIYVNVNTAADSGVEASNLVRFFRWHLILDTFDDPVDVVFGLGPSFVGPSVDGSYLRFLADGGVLGILAWLALIVVWLRRMPLWMVCVTASLLVGALFIDILFSQRPMVLFWALLALAVVQRGSSRSAEPAAVVTA